MLKHLGSPNMVYAHEIGSGKLSTSQMEVWMFFTSPSAMRKCAIVHALKSAISSVLIGDRFHLLPSSRSDTVQGALSDYSAIEVLHGIKRKWRRINECKLTVVVYHRVESDWTYNMRLLIPVRTILVKLGTRWHFSTKNLNFSSHIVIRKSKMVDVAYILAPDRSIFVKLSARRYFLM